MGSIREGKIIFSSYVENRNIMALNMLTIKKGPGFMFVIQPLKACC